MSALELLRLVTYALYLLLFGSVLGRAIRAPRRRNVDVAIFFGATAAVIVIVSFRTLVRPPADLSAALMFTAIAVLVAVPYLFLRLAHDFGGVPGTVLRAAEIGVVASVALLAAQPLAELPAPIVLLLGAWLAVTLGYCCVTFIGESRRWRGVTRRRMEAVAVGSGFLGVALAMIGVGATSPQLQAFAAPIGQVAQLLSGVAYFVGFAPPPPLCRFWQMPALRRFLSGVSRLSGAGDLRAVVEQIELGTAEAFGASLAWVALHDDLRRELGAWVDGAWVRLPHRGTLAERVFADQRPHSTEDLRREYPGGAPGGSFAATIALAAPITSGDRRIGVLAVGTTASLFSEDDLAMLTVLAAQAAIVLENARLLQEVRILTDEAQRHAYEMTTRLATIVESSSDAIIGKTLDGTITSWNRGAEHLYGYGESEMIGRPITMLTPPDRSDEIPGLLGRLRHGERIDDLLTKRLRKDGSIVDVALSLSPIRDADGAVIGAATIARDISARLEAERERERLEGRLRQSERLESVGRLAGGIAHDFNNILTIIISYAEFALDALAKDHPARADVTQISKAADRATAFIRQLLAFAKRDPVHLETLRLGAMVEEMHDMLRRTLPASVEMRTRIAKDLWPIEADAGRIEQVLVNLAVNASDAMPDGGTLFVDAANLQLDDTAGYLQQDLRPGPYVCLRVTDTGVGMTRDVLERAWEPFFTTKAPGEGTGLGLATVYGIVSQAGGGVNIYSEPGKGTSIGVLLPAMPGAAAATPEAPAVPMVAPRAAAILLVEDEDAVREAARRILDGAGYRVVAAGGPAAALDALRERGGDAFDVLLTDMVMPEASGRQLAERVRALQPRIAVVYMSGYSEELVRMLERLDGPLVQKPFTRASLLATVGGVLAEA